jgi:hypothetical protein
VGGSHILKARIVKPEKQLLLANGSKIFLSRQRLGTWIPAATDTLATIEVLMETVFSTRSVQRGYKEGNWGNQVSSIRESGEERQPEGNRHPDRT